MDKKLKKLLDELLRQKIKTLEDLLRAKRYLAKKYNIVIPQNSTILKFYKNNGKTYGYRPELEKLLRKRAIRTLSGIAPVAVLTMPYPCPGKCAYCPSEKNIPQSYLSNEPAVMRAVHCNFHPYQQVQYRLRALEANGHNPNKIELIVIGGTWSVLPQNYQYWFIWQCFQAANDFVKNKKIKSKQRNFNTADKLDKLKKLLLAEQKKNETAKYRLIGITLETRPDYITVEELWQMRALGATRVELGVQALDDEILKLNKRGHGVAEIAKATALLRLFGLKITYHIMPGLPGATPAKDLAMFKKLFSDARFQPDQIKFYPTVVTRGSLLYRWWQQGKYRPYSAQQLENLIIACKKIVPKYVRIIRLIRDIPSESIIAGNIVTNLRQIMQQRGAVCNCIRCREPRTAEFKMQNAKFKIIQYATSIGKEFFLSFESKDEKTLYGFLRLTLYGQAVFNITSPVLHQDTALIRELHVYGELVPVGQKKIIQHSGLGKKLMAIAEKIARENGYKKISVISGIGVRNFYRKAGYRLSQTYMLKSL